MALQPEFLVLSAVNMMGTKVPSVTFDDPVVPGSPVVVPARPRHFVEVAGFIIIFAICCIAGWAVFFANAEQRKEMEEKIAERLSEWKKQLLSCMKPASGPTEQSGLLLSSGGVEASIIAELDGLRPVLTVIIMMLHYGVHPARNPELSRDPLEEWQAEQLIRNGGNGIVDIFFIIAGFVSTRPTAQAPADVRSFLSAILKRWLRLAPLYYVALAFTLGLKFVVPPAWATDKSRRSSYYEGIALPFFLDLTMLQAWFPVTTALGYLPFLLNGPLWFVSCLLWTQAIHLLIGEQVLRRITAPSQCFAWALSLSMLRAAMHPLAQLAPPNAFWRTALLHWPPCAFVGFLAGAFTAKLSFQLAEGKSSVQDWHGWIIADIPCALFWICVSMNMTTSIGLRNDHLQPLVCVFLFLMRCKHKGLVLQMLAHPALTSLGPLAYGAYCLQYPVVSTMKARHWSLEKPTATISYLAIAWLLSGCFARFIERPWSSCTKEWHERFAARRSSLASADMSCKSGDQSGLP